MDLNNKIGFKVTNKTGATGSILKYDGRYITVQFGETEKEFASSAFVEGFLTFDDPASQSEVDAEIKVTEAKKAEEERRRKADEERRRKAAEERRKAEEEAAKKKKPVNIDEMFGKDYHVEYLKRQPILTYQEVEKQFGINRHGFGRGINPTENAIVLISSIDKENGSFVYHDHWDENGDYIYSGEGQIGDHTMTGGNAAIKEAAKDGKTLYLFVKFSPAEYYFQGRFVCVDTRYEDDEDKNGNIRKELKFRLRKIDE